MVHIGMDVHPKTTTLGWFDAATGELSSRTLTVPTDGVVEAVRSIAETSCVVLEAGGESVFVTRRLQSCGIEVAVVDPRKARRVIEAHFTAKSDRLDARGLALCFARGHLDGARIWVPDEITRKLRELTRAREAAVREGVVLQNQIRKFLGRLGIRWAGGTLRSRAARRHLTRQEGELAREYAQVLRSLRRRWELCEAEITELSRTIKTALVQHPDTALLLTIPGVGPITAATIAAEIGDIARFRSAGRLRGYTGLVPRVRQSGERRVTGPLTKAGNRHLRRALVHAAQHFIQSQATTHLALRRRWYAALAGRRGRNPAKVALARRLTDIIYAMLRDRVPFRHQLHRLDEAA